MKTRAASSPACLHGDVAVAQLREHAMRSPRPTDGDHVRMVLRRCAEQRRAADVDLLDRIVPLDVEPRDGLLERIEVDADEIDRRDSVRLEIRHVLGNIAASEDAAVDGRVQRNDAMSEHLGEAGQILERRHREPVVRRAAEPCHRSRRARSRAQQLLRECGDPGLVVDGEQRAPHAASSSLTTSGSRRCSTTRIRACSVSARVAREDGHGLLREHGPVSTPSSTR